MRQLTSKKQGGFTLYMVLVLMAIIAILVLAGGQTLNTEMRVSSNDADRKYAFSLAEEALKAGEVYAADDVHQEVLETESAQTALNTEAADRFFDSDITNLFDVDCDAGKCLPAMQEFSDNKAYSNTPAWERKTKDGKDYVINTSGIEYKDVPGGDQAPAKNPRYIIEYLGPADSVQDTLYRVTARAWGRNAHTEVTVQSVIRVGNKED